MNERKALRIMSFSSEVKKELAAVWPVHDCCRAAQAYGMLECGHGFSMSGISLQTESREVADLYASLLESVCGVKAERETTTAESASARQRKYHVAAVRAEAERLRVLRRFGHESGELSVRLNRANLECEACAHAYLRGAFLSCGAVTDPKADYHMEFSLPYYNLSRDLLALLREVGFGAKEVQRKGSHIVYIKESEQIEDCLTLMGAQNASLELMNVKIVKDIRNKANRITNCESANIDKTVAAASVQLEAVKRIERTCGLGALPEDLRELAELRLDNPELSLRELGELLPAPLSRSGVNHRLRRIVDFADKL